VSSAAVSAAAKIPDQVTIFGGVMAEASHEEGSWGYLVARTNAIIQSLQELKVIPYEIKLFSYGAACPALVADAFPSCKLLSIYGSGKSFEQDRMGLEGFTGTVNVFKSTCDRFSPFQDDSDDPDLKQPNVQRVDVRELASVVLTFPLNLLIVQGGRKELIKKGKFSELCLTHAELGGTFLMET